ncbi:type II secretion system minor pseudopilin [Kozakia baliensis]|uniref:Uncharacterized protein n=2 Tax=Kozakia baliensis TaxID=153496 RepID=A0A1D8UYV5_9PROT|nr:type II secretion system protein GspK [Kozakia baliensis]AOX18845.1 hypothetical protein A0U89_16295 [Kozakia baliensis]GEL65538.1 general secretion pathway protein GspK [Kozakia baliensis]
MKSDRGFALLIVLWSLVFISFVLSVLMASADRQLRLAMTERRAAQMQAVADGAIWQGVFHATVGGAQHWQDGQVHEQRSGSEVVRIVWASEAGLINPNMASRALFTALLQLCGARAEQARALAFEIAVWRGGARTQTPASIKTRYLAAGLSYAPPQEPFRSVSELGLVLGMTPQLLAAVSPHLSVYQLDEVDPAAADGVVQQALKLSGEFAASPRTGSVRRRTITVTAEVRDGKGQTIRHAVIAIGAGQINGTVLHWW